MSDENENAIRNVYIQTIQDLAKERDDLKEKLAVAMGALEAIAYWKSDANCAGKITEILRLHLEVERLKIKRGI